MVTGVFPPDINGAVLQAQLIMRELYDSFDFKVLASPLKTSQNVESEVNIFRFFEFSSFGGCLRTIFRLLDFFNHYRFNIIHFHGFSRKVFLVAFLGKLYGAKLILKHSSLGKDDLSSLASRGFLYRILLSFIDAFVAPSPVFFVPSSDSKQKSYLIPNCVDVHRFKPLRDKEEVMDIRQELGIPLNSFVILGVGHFSAEKRLSDIVEASMLVPRKHHLFSIVLIGSRNLDHFEVSGRELSKIEGMDKRSEPYVEIKYIDRTTCIEKYMQVANLYVLSSEREGLPNSLLEAMACGIPSISTNLPGITDWVIQDEYDGLLYDVGEVTELANLIEYIYTFTEQANRLSLAGREKIIRMFSVQFTMKAYKNLYRDLTSSSQLL